MIYIYNRLIKIVLKIIKYKRIYYNLINERRINILIEYKILPNLRNINKNLNLNKII